MSPRFYSYLWILCVASAGLVWLFGAMTMVVTVAYGFVAFGLIFAGMMCVLPGVVGHPTEESPQSAEPRSPSKKREADPSMVPVHFPLNPKFH